MVLTSSPAPFVQNQDDGVLDASITASAVSLTISPVKKWVNGVYTTGGFNSTKGFCKIIDSTGRYEFISFDTASVSASFVTTLSGIRRGLSPTTSAYGAGTGMAFDANTRIFVCDYALMWQTIMNTDAAQNIDGKKTFTVPPKGAVYATFGDLPAGSNGDMDAYVTADGVFYDYISGAWTQRATGTTPNGSTTVAGKFEEATVAEQESHTATGGTGARLIPSNANLVTLGADGTWISGAIPTLNTAKFLDGSIGGIGAATPVTGALLIGGGAGAAMTSIGPGSSGQIPISNGTTLAMGSPPNYVKVVYDSGINSGALSNPTSLTPFDTHTYTIPANDLIAGVEYEYDIYGLYAWGAGSIAVGVQLGGSTVFAGTSVGLATPNAGDKFHARGKVIGTAAAGASVAVRGPAFFMNNNAAGVALPYVVADAANNFATNGTLVLRFLFLFSSSNGGNSATLTSARIVRYSTTAS